MTDQVITAVQANREEGTRIDHRSWFHSMARVGLASRGIIYILLAYLAFDIARHGRAPTQTSGVGALQEVKVRAGGTELLVVLAIGLACYAVWRIIDAGTQKDANKRVASLIVAVIYVGLCVEAARLIAGKASSSGAPSNPAPLVAKVLRWTGGPAIVDACGIALIGAGAVLAMWGIVHHFERDLALEQIRPRTRRLVQALGGMGNAARGFLVILVGIYVAKAGVTANPSQAKSVDDSLESLVGHSYGAFVIGLVAAGLLCFALFSFFDARLRRL